MRPAFGHRVMIWMLFFVICMGLGYPTLNRYDPRSTPGLSDSIGYYALVNGGDDAGIHSHRVLVPYLARPIYWLAVGHTSSWNPVFFALLVVNSFFIASTAYLLVMVAPQIVGDYPAALLGGLLYLVNFAVSNWNLSGYVDSAVNCLLVALVWTLFKESWWPLVFWGALGALAKETFVPLAAVFAIAWWLTACWRGQLKLLRLAWIGAMVAVGFLILTLLMARGSVPNSPLSFAFSQLSESGSRHSYFPGLFSCLFSRELLFTFAWLVPLGIWRLGRLPRAWVVGSACSAVAALAMGAYVDALGNVARPIFSACGPLLSLSAALLLVEIGKRREPQVFGNHGDRPTFGE